MDYKRKQTLRWPAVLALVVAMTLAAYLIALAMREGGDTPLSSVVRLNTVSNRDVRVSGKNVYYLEGGSLHCVTSEGKYVWNLGVDSDSEFSASEHGVAVWNRKKLTLVDKETGHLLTSKTMDGEILSALVGDRYAAVVIGPEHASTVALLNSSGDVVDTLTSFDGYTVLDYGFYEGQELFWIMTLDSAGSTPSCRISTFIPGKRETGTIEDTEQVIYQVMFRSNYIAAVGTNYLRLYDYTANEKKNQRVTVYGWYMEAVDKRSDDPLMLFVPNQQMEGSIAISDVRMIRGSSEQIVHLPVVCSTLLADGSTMYGFSQEYLVCSAFGEKKSTVYKLPVLVDTVIGITTDHTAVVTSGGSIYLIRLP